ncbi:MAG: hypothetical protein U0230_17535 [Polyangiales bacterium]
MNPSFLHPSHRSSRALRRGVCLALGLALSTGSPSASAQSAEVTETSAGPRRSEPSSSHDLALTPPMRRAVRTTRAGVGLVVVGGLGTIASGIVWARIDDDTCPDGDPLCLGDFPKAMGSFSGMVIGSAMVAAGLVTLSIGVARRNHLRRVEGIALGVGPSELDLRLRF